MFNPVTEGRKDEFNFMQKFKTHQKLVLEDLARSLGTEVSNIEAVAVSSPTGDVGKLYDYALVILKEKIEFTDNFGRIKAPMYVGRGFIFPYTRRGRHTTNPFAADAEHIRYFGIGEEKAVVIYDPDGKLSSQPGERVQPDDFAKNAAKNA